MHLQVVLQLIGFYFHSRLLPHKQSHVRSYCKILSFLFNMSEKAMLCWVSGWAIPCGFTVDLMKAQGHLSENHWMGTLQQKHKVDIGRYGKLMDSQDK